MAKSEAAKTVKFGFWIAVGFWVFWVIMAVIILLIFRAIGKD